MNSLINLNGKIALVTGASQGIGFELCRQLAINGCTVILTSRDVNKGDEATAKLKDENHDIIYHQLDITNHNSIDEIFRYIVNTFRQLDILINNAGVYIDDGNIVHVSPRTIQKSSEVNALGPLLMCQKFIPLMQNNNFGRIVNISSGMGVIETMECDSPAYRISKAVLNAITKMLSKANFNENVLINAVCPGPVRTKMSNEYASITPSEACTYIIDICRLPNGGNSGCFFRYGNLIAW